MSDGDARVIRVRRELPTRGARDAVDASTETFTDAAAALAGRLTTLVARELARADREFVEAHGADLHPQPGRADPAGRR